MWVRLYFAHQQILMGSFPQLHVDFISTTVVQAASHGSSLIISRHATVVLVFKVSHVILSVDIFSSGSSCVLHPLLPGTLFPLRARLCTSQRARGSTPQYHLFEMHSFELYGGSSPHPCSFSPSVTLEASPAVISECATGAEKTQRCPC